MNDENNKRYIEWMLGDFAPDFEKKANSYWEDVYGGPSREEIEKDVKIYTNLMIFKDQVELRASYGPDRHGYRAEEHDRIDYYRYSSDPGFVGLIEEKLTQNVVDRIVRMYEADRIRATMTAEDSIKKYNVMPAIKATMRMYEKDHIEAATTAMNPIKKHNVMPAIKKEENKMSVTGKRMIATVGGGVDISDIQVYNNKVVKVVFSDGSFTKSVCGENDTFDLDVGITICVIKRMAGKDGHRWYNNMIRKAHDIMDRNAEEKQKYQDYKQKVKERNKKEQEKRKAGKEKAKQEQIDIHSEAFLNALKTWKMLEKKHNGAVGD